MLNLFNSAKAKLVGGFAILLAIIGLSSILLGHFPWENKTASAGGGDWVNYGTSFGERQPQSGSYTVGQTVSAGWNALKPVSGMEAEAQPSNVEVTVNRLTNIWGTDVSKGQAAFSDQDVANYARAGFPNGGYEHAFARVSANVSGDTSSSNWQLSFNWNATSPGYYQIDITPRGNEARSLGWVAVRVEGAPVTTTTTQPAPPSTQQAAQINCTSLVANTSSVRIGDNITLTPNVSTNSGLSRIEVFYYNPANQSPNSEQGWTLVGTVSSSGQQISWNTRDASPGSHVFTMVVYDASGNKVADWRNGACTTTVNFAPATTGAANISCTSLVPSANSLRIGDSLNLTTNVSTNQALGRIEVFYHNPANQSPNSELGWTHIGTTNSSGNTISWNTSEATEGNHVFTMVVYDGGNTRVADWRTGACTTNVNFTRQAVGGTNCPYTSTQARLARNTDWDTFKVINSGEAIKVGAFHNNNTGTLATDVRLDLTGPQNFTNIANGSTISPTQAGDYTLTVTTPNYTGDLCQAQAVLRVLGATTTTAAPSPTQTQTQTQTVNITQAAAPAPQVAPQVTAQAAPKVLPKTGADALLVPPVLLGLWWAGRKLRKNFRVV